MREPASGTQAPTDASGLFCVRVGDEFGTDTSGISTSLTFAVAEHSGAEILQALRGADYRIPDYSECLHATCRNNHLEHFLRGLVQERGAAARSLAYLGVETLFLPAAQVAQAARELRAIVDSIVLHAEAWTASLSLHCRFECSLSWVVKAFADPPQTLAAAIARYETKRRADDGDNLPTYAAFLYAHLAVLEQALARRNGVIYALWLY